MWLADKWKDYQIIDTSDGEKLESWGKYSLIRPDPQVIWKSDKRDPLWTRADASYKRSHSGGGAWSENRLPESWNINYGDLRFKIKPMDSSTPVFFLSRQRTGIGCVSLLPRREDLLRSSIFLHIRAVLRLLALRRVQQFVTLMHRKEW